MATVEIYTCSCARLPTAGAAYVTFWDSRSGEGGEESGSGANISDWIHARPVPLGVCDNRGSGRRPPEGGEDGEGAAGNHAHRPGDAGVDAAGARRAAGDCRARRGYGRYVRQIVVNTVSLQFCDQGRCP